MPRGNDTSQAVIELGNQYGTYENAEELIRGHRANLDPAVIRAGILPINEEETEKWKKERFEEAAEKLGVGEDETLLDVAQRGNALSGVILTADGSFRKAVTGANDRYVAPVLSPSEEADRERHRADQAVAAEVARLRAANEAELANMRSELQAEQELALQKIREEMLGIVPGGSPDVAVEAVEETVEDGEPEGEATEGEAEVEDEKPKAKRRGKLADDKE